MSLPQVQPEGEDLEGEVRRRVDDYRGRCLWSLREDLALMTFGKTEGTRPGASS